MANAWCCWARPEEGLVAIRRYMRLDPFFPPHALMVEGLAHLVQRRYKGLASVSRNDCSSTGLSQRTPHVGGDLCAHRETREARRQVEELLQGRTGLLTEEVIPATLFSFRRTRSPYARRVAQGGRARGIIYHQDRGFGDWPFLATNDDLSEWAIYMLWAGP